MLRLIGIIADFILVFNLYVSNRHYLKFVCLCDQKGTNKCTAEITPFAA